VQYRTTTWSMCRFSIDTHRQSEHSHPQNHTQWSSRNQRHGNSTACSTLVFAIGSCLIASTWPVTTTYTPAESLWCTFKMPKIWLTSIIEIVRIGRRHLGIELGVQGKITRKQFGPFNVDCFCISFSSLWFFHSLFPYYVFLLYPGIVSPCGLWLERGIM